MAQACCEYHKNTYGHKWFKKKAIKLTFRKQLLKRENMFVELLYISSVWKILCSPFRRFCGKLLNFFLPISSNVFEILLCVLSLNILKSHRRNLNEPTESFLAVCWKRSSRSACDCLARDWFCSGLQGFDHLFKWNSWILSNCEGWVDEATTVLHSLKWGLAG